MKKVPETFIKHILDSIEFTEEYLKKVSQEKFHKNRQLQDAIIRRLEIIGEAVKNLPGSFKEKYPEVPWKKMAGMRDVLIHEYFDVDLFLTWKVVKQEFPIIKKKLSKILADASIK